MDHINSVKRWASQIPVTTLFVFSINIVIFVIFNLINVGTENFCILPSEIVRSKLQGYRIFTSAWFHFGILHILFNMMSLLSMGRVLERGFGSVQFAHFLLLCNFLTGMFDFLALHILSLLSEKQEFSYSCDAGFSGILFALLYLECYSVGSEERSVCGFVNVSRKSYPWISLILISILLPHVSFLGHLGGILVGIAYVNGYMNWMMLSPQMVTFIESNQRFQKITSMRNFVSNTSWNGDLFGVRSSNPVRPTPLPLFQNTTYPSQSNWSMAGSGRTLGSELSNSNNPHTSIPMERMNQAEYGGGVSPPPPIEHPNGNGYVLLPNNQNPNSNTRAPSPTSKTFPGSGQRLN
eukprot:TRINITY_DN6373_c0_g1_i1.p1 TRINITY_DN6373_c0_g1~~TRINITY_DN6373_c0_g1_i1.p1  ORF type:complete len:360 (+),score=101.19 TRINITY_DN6373_c0_g1_i1:29-1081(+)